MNPLTVLKDMNWNYNTPGCQGWYPRLARVVPPVAKGRPGVAGLSSGEISPPDGRGVSRGATPSCQGWYPRLARVVPSVAKGGPRVAGLSSRGNIPF